MVISLEEGWNTMQDGINNILEGMPEPQFTSDGYMILYMNVSIPDHVCFFLVSVFSIELPWINLFKVICCHKYLRDCTEELMKTTCCRKYL
jgi:hypothetical protein